MMIIARARLFEHIYCIKFVNRDMPYTVIKPRNDAYSCVKGVQGQVQHTLSEVQFLVNAEFAATISARVSPIIRIKIKIKD